MPYIDQTWDNADKLSDYNRLAASHARLVAALERFTDAMRHKEQPDLLLLIEALHEADAALAQAKEATK